MLKLLISNVILSTFMSNPADNRGIQEHGHTRLLSAQKGNLILGRPLLAGSVTDKHSFISLVLAILLGLLLLTTMPPFSTQAFGEERSLSNELTVSSLSLNQILSSIKENELVDYFSSYLLSNAQLAIENNRYTQATAFVARALENNPKNTKLITLYLELAEKSERWEEVEKLTSQLLEQNPNDSRLIVRRGIARWYQSQETKAAEDFKQALKIGLDDVGLRLKAEKALSEIKAGHPAPDLWMSGDEDYNRINEDWTLVGLMHEQGEWKWLDRFYTRLLKYSPESGSYVYAARGYVRVSMKQTTEAEQDFLAALAQPDLAPETRQSIEDTLALIRSDEYKEAEQKYQKHSNTNLADVDNNDTKAPRPNLTQAVYRQRQAITVGESNQGTLAENGVSGSSSGATNSDYPISYARLEPDEVELLSDWNSRLMSDDNDAEKQSKIEELKVLKNLVGQPKDDIRMAKNAKGTKKTAGFVSGGGKVIGYLVAPNVWDDFKAMDEYLKAGRLAALATTLERLEPLELKGEELGHLAFFQGEKLWADGHYDQAKEKYLECLSLIKDKYRRSTAYWRLTEYSRLKEEKDRAIEYAKNSVEEQPEAYWTLYSIGNLMASYGLYQEASDYFKKFLALRQPDRNEVGIYLNLSNAYNQLGDKEKRLAYLRLYIDRASELYTNSDSKDNADKKTVITEAEILKEAEKLKKESESLNIDPDTLKLESETLFDARRAHANYSRQWGLDSYIFSNSYSNGDYSVQVVNDLYGYVRGGNILFQPYLQLNGSLANSFSGNYYEPFSKQTKQWQGSAHLREALHAAVGVRIYPFPELRHSLALGLEQVVKIGTQTNNDTRLRLYHFWHTGLDLEPYVSNWLYATILNQGIYSFSKNDFTAFGEIRTGRSLRLDSINDRLVLTPHATMVWGYAGQEIESGERMSLETGLGVSVRKWYREDHYNAPMSSTDLTVQYRWGLSNERNDVLSLTLSNSF
jgi:tetratricopeptide (TPR) repeat protein